MLKMFGATYTVNCFIMRAVIFLSLPEHLKC